MSKPKFNVAKWFGYEDYITHLCKGRANKEVEHYVFRCQHCTIAFCAGCDRVGPEEFQDLLWLTKTPTQDPRKILTCFMCRYNGHG